MHNSSLKLFIPHLVLLCVGGVSGLALAYILDGVQWDYSADLKSARDLGIVSEAILKNYPKSRDVLTYFFAFVLPVSGALAVWLPWGLRQRRILAGLICEAGNNDLPQSHPWRPLFFSLAALMLVLSCFDLNLFYDGKWNPVVGSWPFLGEEGVFLEWTQRILNGEVMGKDFLCVYGPLMVYPLVLLQEIAGPLVSLGRWYAFALNLTAYILLAFIISRTIRSTFVALPALLLMVLFYPWMTHSANMSPLRVVLGMVPLLSLLRFRETGKEVWIAAAGACCGVSFLFSQEVGVCALLASLAFAGFSCIRECGIAMVVRRFAVLLAGWAALLLPAIVYFTAKGALPHFIEGLTVYPRNAMLGYAGLVFPSIADAVKSLHVPLVFDNYWIIGTYVLASIVLLIRIILGCTDTRTAVLVFILIFGSLHFRSALGRSSCYEAFVVAPSAFMLLFMALDYCVCRLNGNRNIIRIFMVMLMLAVISAVAAGMSHTRSNLVSFGNMLLEKNRFTRIIQSQLIGVERDDVRHHPGTALEIQSIADFFRSHPTPDNYVYFFPQEPAYYFIFNKKNPTRYATSYLAATSEMRRELVADLEKRKPLYAVYSRSTWRIDGIPSYVQVPEVYGYLEANYEVLLDYGAVVFLKRKQAHG